MQLPSAAWCGSALNITVRSGLCMVMRRYVEAMQQASEADQATEIGADSSAAGSSKGSGSHVYEKLLAELLGARSPHVLHQMNKLLLLESQAFGR